MAYLLLKLAFQKGKGTKYQRSNAKTLNSKSQTRNLLILVATC